MKLIKIMISNVNKLLFIIMFFYSYSCKAQSSDSSFCKEFNDFKGRVYKKECFKGNILYKTFYVDTTGKKIEVCSNPETEASAFNSKKEFYSFVENNLEWPACSDFEGNVYFAILIDEKGNIIEKRVLKEMDYCQECTINAAKLIDKFNKWQPAIYENNQVKSIKYLMIPFK